MVMLPAFPMIFLATAILAVLLLGALRDEDEGSRVVMPVAIAALIITGLLIIASDKGPVDVFGGHLLIDGFSSFLSILVIIGAVLCLVMTPGQLRRLDADRFEVPVIALVATLGMLLMISANSFLALYMALELQSLPLYVMTAIRRDDVRSTEAGLKYFVLGALASGILLYGCSLVYGFTGTLSFPALAGTFGADNPLPNGAITGLVFIAAGLAFKISAVPFHMWTPDVYEGAPTPVTAFLAAAPKVAAMGLILRVFMQPFGSFVDQWQQVIVFISIASMLLGAFAAIGQTSIKRLLAYSSIGHVGYALVGLSAGTERGVYAVMIYMAIYLFMTVGSFACVMALRRQDYQISRIEEFAGLGRTQPMMALALAIFMFSLAGIPPLAGFFGKLYVFMAAVEQGLIGLAVIGVLASVVGAYYYLRIVKLMYFDEPKDAFDRPVSGELGFVVTLTAAFTLLFCLYPSPLLTRAQAAAATLFIQ
ncbi:MAG: NADH-quinone oxidoreductase subunit NuoN [Geminicoccaceae bacterium]